VIAIEIYPENIFNEEKPSDDMILMEVDFNQIQFMKTGLNSQEKSDEKKVLVTNNKSQQKISDFF